MNTMTEDLRVMTSGAFTAAYLELIPRLELLTKKKLVTAATSIGTGETSSPNRLRRGEPVDVVIVADSLLVGFIKDGLIMAESYTPVARSANGMAVRAGAPKPDIGTVGEEKGGKRGRESFVDRTARVGIDAMSNATASSFSNRWIGIPRPESTYWSAPII